MQIDISNRTNVEHGNTSLNSPQLHPVQMTLIVSLS